MLELMTKCGKISGSEQGLLSLDGPYTERPKEGRPMSGKPTYSAIIDKSVKTSEGAKAIPAQPLPTRANFRNISGQVFYRLTVIDFVGKVGLVAAWKCRCECGNYSIITANALLQGSSRPCIACSRQLWRKAHERYNQEALAKRLPNLSEGATAKACCECKVVKSLEEFGCRRTEPDGLMRQCRDCVKKRRTEWTANNREHLRKANRPAWQKHTALYPERRREAQLKANPALLSKPPHPR